MMSNLAESLVLDFGACLSSFVLPSSAAAAAAEEEEQSLLVLMLFFFFFFFSASAPRSFLVLRFSSLAIRFLASRSRRTSALALSFGSMADGSRTDCLRRLTLSRTDEGLACGTQEPGREDLLPASDKDVEEDEDDDDEVLAEAAAEAEAAVPPLAPEGRRARQVDVWHRSLEA